MCVFSSTRLFELVMINWAKQGGTGEANRAVHVFAKFYEVVHDVCLFCVIPDNVTVVAN